jgi:AcrR family transcriptional regulator
MTVAKRRTDGRRATGAGRKPAVRRPAHSARGELARARLKDAAARVLERVGFRQMRVADVTREAGVAAGLFYHYFPDLKTLTIEVLRDFMTRFEAIDEIELGVERGDWYARSHAHNLLVVQSYARNPGIMRCMVQLGDEEPEFGEIWRASYYRRLELLVRAMPRLFPAAALVDAEARLVTTMLAGIGEHVLSEYYIVKAPQLRELAMSEEQMAEWITVMFHRALFLENPREERLRHAVKVLDMRPARRGARVSAN